MARIRRIVLPGHPHHVTQRGVRSMNIFTTDEDRSFYVQLLREQGDKHGVRFLSYCLMDNHVHLIVVPETEKSLSRSIGEAHRRFTRQVNFRLGVKGYLFQGRFFSCPLDERHLIAATCYVERNPVRAGMVPKAWQYRWSSARFRLGIKRTDPLVDDPSLFGLVNDWKAFLGQDPLEIEKLRKSVRTGRPCGEDSFLRLAERMTKRQLKPQAPGPKKGSRK